MHTQSPKATVPVSSSMPAPRALVLLAVLVLALSLTGGTVLARTVFVRPAPALPAPTSGPDVALVRAFYAAVNGVLATGSPDDLADLSALVADDFVEYPNRPGTSPGRAGLLEALTAVRRTHPALRLVVEDVRSLGDHVAARIRLEGADGTFLGIPLDAAQVPWGPIDLFRVDGGAIVEHWGVPGASAHLLPLTQGAIALPGGAADPRRRPALERRTYAPVATWSGETAIGPVLILGQTGTVKVTVDVAAPIPARLVHAGAHGRAAAGEPIAAGVAATVVPGDLLVLAPGTRFTSSNWEAMPATVLLVTLEEPVIPGGAPITKVPPPEGITRATVATGPAVPIPSEATVRIGWMTLAQGSAFPTRTAGGIELLLVASGALALVSGDEPAWISRGDNPGSTAAHLATLAAGDAAAISPNALVGYRNTGGDPVTLLLLTILPA